VKREQWRWWWWWVVVVGVGKKYYTGRTSQTYPLLPPGQRLNGK
jgi:hypothetical protein